MKILNYDLNLPGTAPTPGLHEAVIRVSAFAAVSYPFSGSLFSGIVESVSDSDHAALTGKRVAVLPHSSCGFCPLCRSNREHLCARASHVKLVPPEDGRAVFAVVSQSKIYPIPDSISFEEAALTDAVSLAIAACGKAAPFFAEDFLVCGEDELAMMIIPIARLFGARKVVYAGAKDKHALALAMGADEVLSMTQTDELAGITGGEGVRGVADTLCNASSHRFCLNALGGRGKMICLRPNDTEIEYVLKDFSAERFITVVTGGPYANFRAALRMMESGKIDLRPVIGKDGNT